MRYTGLWRAVPRFTPLGMWATLAASPLVLAAVAAPRRAADNRRPGSTFPKSATAQQAAAADPAGTAKMFVDLWLRANASIPHSAAAGC
ncbi:hypothetical protein ACGFX2_37815 [Streptomyces goshikiensis]|uniref:hypothetical protein n=1 Tax=Streptomyces goshikiensis TaxID=1942 RepID=UPI0037177318